MYQENSIKYFLKKEDVSQMWKRTGWIRQNPNYLTCAPPTAFKRSEKCINSTFTRIQLNNKTNQHIGKVEPQNTVNPKFLCGKQILHPLI